VSDLEKPKKVQKMFDAFKIQIESAIKSFEDKTNKDLVAYKNKVNQMYSALVREFLVKLEGRVRVSEIVSLSLVKVYSRKLYELEKKIDPNFNMSYEEYAKSLEKTLNEEQLVVRDQIEQDDKNAMAVEQEKTDN
jgi:hypothetical protein